EIVSTGRPVPQTWVRSNPIYVRGVRPALPTAPKTAEVLLSLIDQGTNWHVEHDPGSQASVDVTREADTPLHVRYALSDGNQAFSSLVVNTLNGIADYDRLAVVVRAERPMRLSVQLRTEDAKERWQRSIYVDTFDQLRTISFDDMTPIGATSTSQPTLDRIGS